MPQSSKRCLLNPGPVTLTSRVRQALLREDLCHREPEYAELQQDIRRRLAAVYPEAAADYAAVLFTGSGTAAVESMVTSLIPPDGLPLVAANGVYGERMAAMLDSQHKPHELLRGDWTRPLNLDAIERRLAGGGISHVIAVHHETTTGRLNDLPGLGALCVRYQVPLLLDAVSSFGGESLEFAPWNLQACAATANKCLHGVPGVSFVLVRQAALRDHVSAATSVYLDLFRNHAEQAGGSTLFTPSVQVLYALQEALRELDDQGGWRQRQARYARLSTLVRDGLRQQGIQLWLDDAQCGSSTLTSFRLPEGMEFAALYEPLKDAGFIIYAGQRWLYEKIFRVAVMGDLDEDDMERFVAAVATPVEMLRAAPGKESRT